MDNQSLQRIKDLIARSQKIAVAVGKNPSIDDMGAALGLYLSLNSMGKTVTVVSPTEPIVEISNLVGIDKVKTRYESSGADLVVSFPYKEGEIEKVSYTIENGYLNIVVKAGDQGLTFSEQEVKYDRGGGNGQLDLLIAVGTSQLSDLQSVFDMAALKDVSVVNIDNKEDNQGYGDIVLVSPRFSSVSEQISQLLEDLQMEIDVDAAQNLMDGIAYATENFQSPRTSYLAFQMAGVLMRQGAIRSRVVASAPQNNFRQPAVSQTNSSPQQMSSGQPQRRPQNNAMPQQQQRDQDRRSQQFDQQRRQPQSQQNRPIQQQQSRPMPQVSQIPSSQQQPFTGTQGGQQQRGMQPQPMNQPAPQQPPVEDFNNPPSDWLTPKVYKGSTNI
jgi:hypothetical protein